jgi:hypothetical protein
MKNKFSKNMIGTITGLIGLLLVLFIVPVSAGPPQALGADLGTDQKVDQFSMSDEDAWMQGYTLIFTNAKNLNEAYEAVDLIRSHGGRVGVIISPQLMLGWIPAENTKALIGKAKIKGIYKKQVSGAAQLNNETADVAAAFFNDVVSGAYKERKAAQRANQRGAMLPDARKPGRISYMNYIANLQAKGITTQTLAANGISFAPTAAAPSPGNSDFMVGKVLFNVMFVESNNPNQNRYTWTVADRTSIQNEIIAGLSWWANTASVNSTYDTPLTFVVNFYLPTDTRMWTSYEPILYSSSQDDLWINQIMGNLGYSSGDKFARTTAFNTAQRIANKTNWSVVSFVAYNPSPAPTKFTDGYFAYSYIGGPYSQLLFRNDGWATSQYDIVNAHETGHLFGAQDEYYQAGYGGCTSCGVSRNGVLNANCEYCNPNAISCMMRNNSLGLCGYTAGQIGWTSLKNMYVQTYSWGGAYKDFFVPGEKIRYNVYYCLTGPRLGTRLHNVKVRFRADFYSGSINLPSTSFDDTGWGAAGTVFPPTSTGLLCYNTWWNRTVPLTVQYGPATVTAQITIADYGKADASDSTKFYVAPFGNKTESAPLPAPAAMSVEDAGPGVEIDKGPSTTAPSEMSTEDQ